MLYVYLNLHLWFDLNLSVNDCCNEWLTFYIHFKNPLGTRETVFMSSYRMSIG